MSAASHRISKSTDHKKHGAVRDMAVNTQSQYSSTVNTLPEADLNTNTCC